MGLRIGAEMPGFDGATGWLNGEVRSDELAGHPVVVQFWAVSCPACTANQPAFRAMKDTYAELGVRYVAVHLPRIPQDTEADKAEQKAQAIGLTDPCALDNEGAIGNSFETSGLWPYYFLFDSQGKLKRRAAGGMGLRLIGASLQRMAEHGAAE
jgi:thiol-disulfide isomerase/thioredoxin